MDKQQLLEYCMSKPGSEQDYQDDWHADRIKVAHKMFALLGEAHGRPVISLKCGVDKVEELRQQYPDIVPGFYLNKTHWNSLYLDGSLQSSQIYQLIDLSYQLVVDGLPEREQQRLLALSRG